MVRISDINAELDSYRNGAPFNYPVNPVSNIQRVAAPGIKELQYTCDIAGTKETYSVNIKFRKMEFKNNSDADFRNLVKQRDGSTVYHKQIDLKETPVALKCSCSDFRFRFEYPLHQKKGLIGNFTKYTKVPGSNRPPVNPDNLLGYCKHIHSLLTALDSSNDIKTIRV